MTIPGIDAFCLNLYAFRYTSINV